MAEGVVIVGAGPVGLVAACLLVVGLLLALAPLIGPWGALAVVVGGLLAVTALCALGMVRRIGSVRKALRGPAGNKTTGDPA